MFWVHYAAPLFLQWPLKQLFATALTGGTGCWAVINPTVFSETGYLLWLGGIPVLLACPIDAILAKLACPLNYVIFCLHQELPTYLPTNIDNSPFHEASLLNI